MLTPKHRALFTAAYATPLLRTAGEETEPPPEGRNDSQEPSVEAPADAPAAPPSAAGPDPGGTESP